MTETATTARGAGGGSSPLEVEHLVKRFGAVTALDDVSLRLDPGELVAVVGPSGCGKSTLLRTIGGLLTPDSGRVALGGQLVDDGTTRVPPEGRAVGLVFQDHALFPHLTVDDNVGFGVRNDAGRRASGRELRARVAEMLELVGLGGHGHRFPHELSGGERQRVALARALAPGPALMLFDEPFASIDHNLRVRLRADVVDALRATGTPALFVTHDQSEALAIGDRIAVLRSGRIAQIDTPAVIFHRPADRFVGGFMGEASFVPIERSGADAWTALGALDPASMSDLDPAGDLVAMVRPDDLRFVPVPATETAQPPHPPRNLSTLQRQATQTPQISGDGAEVTDGEYRGSGWLLTVRLDAGPEVLVAASHLDPPELGARGRVELIEGHRQVICPNR